jgi:hypothetical protein
MFGLSKKIEVNYEALKSGFENNTMTIDEIDVVSSELIILLSILTNKGVTQVNKKYTVDYYKQRVWGIIENAGFLPEL